MFKWAPLLVALLVTALSLPPHDSIAAAEEFTARVIGVTDGDTITILRDGTQQRIRLVGIDAPESKQAYGTKAKQFTAKHVFGKDVLIKPAGTDRYGRTLADVVLSNGTSINQLLVREGFAWAYRRYTNDPQLYLQEAYARQRKNGLWSDAEPIAPWDFRRGVTPTATVKPTQPKTRKVRKTKPKQPVT